MGLKRYFGLHQLQPLDKHFVIPKESLVLDNKLLNELGSLVSEKFREIIAQNLNTDLNQQLLSFNQNMDVLIVQAGLKYQEIYRLSLQHAVDALINLLWTR